MSIFGQQSPHLIEFVRLFHESYNTDGLLTFELFEFKERVYILFAMQEGESDFRSIKNPTRVTIGPMQLHNF